MENGKHKYAALGFLVVAITVLYGFPVVADQRDQSIRLAFVDLTEKWVDQSILHAVFIPRRDGIVALVTESGDLTDPAHPQRTPC